MLTVLIYLRNRDYNGTIIPMKASFPFVGLGFPSNPLKTKKGAPKKPISKQTNLA